MTTEVTDIQLFVAIGTLLVLIVGMLGTAIWRLNIVRDSLLHEVNQSFERFGQRLNDHEIASIQRTHSIERDIDSFKRYVEREFVPKEVFNQIIDKMTVETRLVRSEVVERIGNMERELLKVVAKQ